MEKYCIVFAQKLTWNMMEKKQHNEVVAAITMALYEYSGYTVHDAESGVLDIQPDNSEWTFKLSSLRQLPDKKF